MLVGPGPPRRVKYGNDLSRPQFNHPGPSGSTGGNAAVLHPGLG
jgi:hypothetical protein